MQTFFVNIPGVGTWQEPVDTLVNLPATNNNDGDARVTLDTSTIYIWDELGGVWVSQGGGGGGITALTGDVTASGSGSVASTLATVNSNVGSFTYGSFTVNAKGLITAASSGTAPISAVLTGYTSGAGAISSSDTILSAVQKLNGNDALKLPLAGGTMTGKVVSSTPTLTDAATITVDASLGNQFNVTLGGNRTLGAPTNPSANQLIIIAVRQDATGSRTLAYDSGAGGYRFGTDITAITLTTAANKTDYIGFRYNGTDSKWDVVSVIKGY